MSALETSGIETMPIEAMSVLLGELNTEARCVALTVAPTELTAMREINENLRVHNAFGFVDAARFNAQGMLSKMPNSLVRTISEPLPNQSRASWVVKDDGALGEFATGLAGALLRYSLDRELPIRTIIGEKRAGTDEKVPSIETRLGILGIIAIMTEEGRPFTNTEVATIAQDYGLEKTTSRAHVWKLFKQGYLAKSNERTRSYEVAERPNGMSFMDDITELFHIVGNFSVGSVAAIEQGTEDGRAIVRDPNLLPVLVERSYTTSTHTGKSTPHSIKKTHSLIDEPQEQ